MGTAVFRQSRGARLQAIGACLLLVFATAGLATGDNEFEHTLRAAGIEVTRNEADCGVTVTFSRGDQTSYCKKLAELRDVTRVRFAGCTPAPPELAELRRIDGLTELVLLKADLDVDHFQGLGRIEGLRRLSLSQSKLGDNCLEHLARDFPNLEALDLSNTTVTNAALPSIAKLKSLRDLSLASSLVFCSTDYSFGAEPYSLEALSKHPRLERLDFGWRKLGSKDLRILGTLPALTEIQFEPFQGRSYLSGDDLLDLKRANGRIRISTLFAELYMMSRKSDAAGNLVDLRDTSGRAAKLAETKELSAVERFKIGRLDSFQCFQNMPAIRQLHLWHCSVGNEEWKHIADLKELQLLVIERTPVDSAALEALGAARSLERLSIDGKSIEPGEFKQLPDKLPNVEIRALESLRVDGL